MGLSDEEKADAAPDGRDAREGSLTAQSGSVVVSRRVEGSPEPTLSLERPALGTTLHGLGLSADSLALPAAAGTLDLLQTTLLGFGVSPEARRASGSNEDVSGEVERPARPSEAPGMAALRGETMMGLGPMVQGLDAPPSSESPVLPVGAEFCGDFRIVRVIARGGMGTVYEAVQLSTGRRRALKVLHRRFAPDDPSSQRFLAEARVKSRVESEHVVDVVVAGVDPASASLWIAMELLEGETLADRLLALPPGQRLPLEVSWRVLGQLCRGLARAHAQGIVHRDIKPANVFLARSANGPETVKLLDFGIAHVMGSDEGDAAPLGTPLWMAPEQVTRGEITPATDVWAVGLLAFRLFTGFHYWLHSGHTADSLQALLDEVTTEPLVSATARAVAHGFEGELPAGFDAWFARCVARNPSNRFRSAREMAIALAEIMPTVSSLPVLDYVTAPVAPRPTRRPRVLTQAVSSARRSEPPPPGGAAVPAADRPVEAPSPQSLALDPGSAGVPAASPDARVEAPAPRGLEPVADPVEEAPTVRVRTEPPAPVVSVGGALYGTHDGAMERREDPSHSLLSEPLRAAPAPPRVSRAPRDFKRIAAAVTMAFLLGGMTAYAVRVAMTPDTVPLTQVTQIGAGSVALAGPPVWPAGATRRWEGSFVAEHGSWSFVLVLQIDGETTVTGRFTWTAVRVPGTTVTETITEDVTGTYEPTLGHLELTGARSSNHVLFPVRTYRLRVTPEGNLVGSDARNESTRLVGAPVHLSPSP